MDTSVQRPAALRKPPLLTQTREPACPPLPIATRRDLLGPDASTKYLQGPLIHGGHSIRARSPLASELDAHSSTVATNPTCGAPPALLARRVAQGPGTATGGDVKPRSELQTTDGSVATTAAHRATELAKAPGLLDREARSLKKPPDICSVTLMKPTRQTVCLKNEPQGRQVTGISHSTHNSRDTDKAGRVPGWCARLIRVVMVLVAVVLWCVWSQGTDRPVARATHPPVRHLATTGALGHVAVGANRGAAATLGVPDPNLGATNPRKRRDHTLRVTAESFVPEQARTTVGVSGGGETSAKRAAVWTHTASGWQWVGTRTTEPWVWEEAVHGHDSALPKLTVVQGNTTKVSSWTFHDAYCGIGNSTAGMKIAGGKCTAAFDRDGRSRAVYDRRQFGPTPHGAWGSFDPQDWASADVLYSAPPCEAAEGIKFEDRQMWAQLGLVRVHNYKIVIFEQTPYFKRLGNGRLFHQFVSRLTEMGYKVFQENLFAPRFASACRRTRLFIVGVREDVHSMSGDFRFPAGDDQLNGVLSIKEPEFFRRDVRVSHDTYVKLRTPRQHSRYNLQQVGFMSDTHEPVYGVDSLATSQLATGSGYGWTSGLYYIGGYVTRLMLKEVATVMQMDDYELLDDVEAVARRQLACTVPVGMARAMGLEVEALLTRAAQDGPSLVTVAAPPKIDPTLVHHLRVGRAAQLTMGGHALSVQLHELKMIQWQADAALHAAATSATVLLTGLRDCARFYQLTSTQQENFRRGIRFLEHRYWLASQRKRARVEIDKLRDAGADVDTIRHARMTVSKALWCEWIGGGSEERPINLLWWNWKGPIPHELRTGFKLPLRRKPSSTFPDNYESADVEKVWSEFTRMNTRKYMEGPYDAGDPRVFMTHPLAAVPKKGTTKLRLVVDMTASLLNDCLVAHRFILPQVEDVARKCYAGAWMICADLVDGFYGVEVRGEDRQYLGLKHPRTGKYYRYTRLAMGAACSPAAFSRLVAWAVQEAQAYPEFAPVRMVINDVDPNMPRIYGVNSQGLPVTNQAWFVDDGLLVAPTREACQKAYDRLVWVLESRLGWRICSRKTVGPCQRLLFCGLELDTVGRDVGGPCTRLSAERRQRCQTTLATFMQSTARTGMANRRELAGLVGELSFAGNAIPAGRCFLSRLYRALHEMDELEDQRGDSSMYDRVIKLPPQAVLDLMWWKACLAEAECVRLWRSGTFAMHRCWSDASDYGFAESIATAETDHYPSMAFTHGVWPDSVAGHSSNWHELGTIVHSIRLRLEDLRGSNIHYMTDNATAVKGVNTGALRSPKLMKLIRELKLLQAKGNIGLEAIHLRGTMIIRQGADGASRQAPWLGMYSDSPSSHDTFAPVEWPVFGLNGSILDSLAVLNESHTQDGSDPLTWFPTMDIAGQDTLVHVRPCHVTHILEMLLDAQLRQPEDTAFTVIVPQVGMRTWSKYVKHFRRRESHEVHVEGLGKVKHWLLRFERGDGLLPRGVEGCGSDDGWQECDDEHESTAHGTMRDSHRPPVLGAQ